MVFSHLFGNQIRATEVEERILAGTLSTKTGTQKTWHARSCSSVTLIPKKISFSGRQRTSPRSIKTCLPSSSVDKQSQRLSKSRRCRCRCRWGHSTWVDIRFGRPRHWKIQNLVARTQRYGKGLSTNYVRQFKVIFDPTYPLHNISMPLALRPN